MVASRPRKGTLQFWPRKRAGKFLPRTNWSYVSERNEGVGFLGFIGYKAGMKSGFVKDNTEHSLTKGKRIIVPVTIIECPTMKIFSIRYYNKNKLIAEVLNQTIDKEMKKKLKLPKEYKAKEKMEKVEKRGGFDDVKVIVYSQVKKTNVKKKPDVIEVGLSGSLEEKMKLIKDNLAKEISVADVLEKGLVDFRGLTTGRGFSGPVKRFGISFKNHKSEKGVRRPGSLGPWHPARVIFRVPMAGQLGMFTRVVYNGSVLGIENSEKKPLKDFGRYGTVKTDYVIVKGSVQGPAKRQILITKAIRKSKSTEKINYELTELR